MTEEKRNRMIAAITVNVILLVAILTAVVIYQIIDMVILKRERDNLESKISYYLQEKENAETEYDYYRSDAYLMDLAYKYGFVWK